MRTAFWFWLVVVIVFTFLPWHFVGHAHWDAVDWTPLVGRSSGPAAWLRDAPLNFLLFLPLGFLGYRPQARRGLLAAVTIALCVSIAAEWFQVFSHGRFPSINDVIVNGAGAAAGAWLARRAMRSPQPAGG